jgi:predicted HTH domain antitoxin
MTVAVEIPEDMAQAIQERNPDLKRATLEALALEGYRSGTFSDGQLMELLGFESRIEVHAFLKDHGVHLNYSADDLEHDLRMARSGDL